MRKFAQLLLLMTIPFSTAYADKASSQPDTTLSPEDVVSIVINALKTNDETKDDNGLATVFAFASPANKSATGPLPRFKKMIKGGFADMLNHVKSDFGEIDIEDDTALQAVWLTNSSGKETGYVFQIGKQSGGEFDGMWLTESVWPIGVREPTGQSI